MNMFLPKWNLTMTIPMMATTVSLSTAANMMLYLPNARNALVTRNEVEHGEAALSLSQGWDAAHTHVTQVLPQWKTLDL